MKLFIIFNICIVVIQTVFSQNVDKVRNKYHSINSKNSGNSEECKYINSIIGKEESYNCCEKHGIICKDGHIIEL